ncbi:MAG: nuclear transport factor 2 family protein [Flavobacteriaceae bacterium]|nr:nuclear transport factor 2 family protein [Flavobacteriaceae bacterium]
MNHNLSISGILFVFFCYAVLGQVPNDSALFIQLKKSDSLLFEQGFNQCNIPLIEKLITDDFEFYHDKKGIQNRNEFLTGFKESICSNTDKKPIRKLVQGSLNVFRLKNNGATYGPIQKGMHLFYIKESNKKPYITNIAQFSSVWILQNGEWKLSRVLSYDHLEPNKYFKASLPR